MKNLVASLGISTLVLGGAMGAAAFAQAPADQQSTPAAQSAPATPSSDTTSNSASSATPNDSTSYATGKPLAGQSNEGFWGHMNPFARKKWVRRQVDPIRDRTNELDQLQAKNAKDIKDVDERAQAGINKAMMAANTADQHAADAANRANTAQTTASGASTRAESLNGTVSNLDQFKQVSSVDVKFPKGRTTLSKQGKDDLQQMAQQLATEKGYIIEITGYSRGGVQSSQAMADSVARYLVTEQQVPLYRIYRSGLGKAPKAGSNDQTAQTTEEKPLVNGVRVTLLHNSLASLGGADANNPATQQQNMQSTPSTMQNTPSTMQNTPSTTGTTTNQ